MKKNKDNVITMFVYTESQVGKLLEENDPDIVDALKQSLTKYARKKDTPKEIKVRIKKMLSDLKETQSNEKE